MSKNKNSNIEDSLPIPQRGGSNYVVSFNRRLASTEQSERVGAVDELVGFLTQNQEEFSKREAMMLIWKGVFYTFWMADKPLFQQQLADDLAEHLLLLPAPLALLHLECFWSTLIKGWSGIDVHRLDKYLLLQRRFVNAGLRLLSKHNWDLHVISEIGRIFQEGPFHPTSTKVSDAIRYHIIDVFFAELKKALPFDGPTYKIHLALIPIMDFYVNTDNKVARERAQKKVFDVLTEEMLSEPHLEVFKESAPLLAKEWFQVGAVRTTKEKIRTYGYKLVGQLTHAFNLQGLDLVSTLALKDNEFPSLESTAVPIETTPVKTANAKRAPETKNSLDSPKKDAEKIEEPNKKAKTVIESVLKQEDSLHVKLAACAGFKVVDLPTFPLIKSLPKDGEVDPLSNFRVLPITDSSPAVPDNEDCVATHDMYVEDILSDKLLNNKKVHWGLNRNHVQTYIINSAITKPTNLEKRPEPSRGLLKQSNLPIKINRQLLEKSSLGLPACLQDSNSQSSQNSHQSQKKHKKNQKAKFKF